MGRIMLRCALPAVRGHTAQGGPEHEDRATMTTDPKTGQEIVLVLQGGGALGAYQAGIYEAMRAGAYEPGWVAGISIGGINAAIIAGNPPERRVERLNEFWEQVTSTLRWKPFLQGDTARPLFTTLNSIWVAGFGVPGFFQPRFPSPLLAPVTPPEQLGYYDTRPLRQTLERLVDFDRINARHVRLSVGAVNVRTGNFTYFDNQRQKIGPEHVMASGAIPPGFPPVEIDGEFYWDGGIVSNAPIQYVLDQENKRDLLIFQVDLFSARGDVPTTMPAAAEREKDIRYSSRTRMNTDMGLKGHQVKSALRRLLDRLPNDLRNLPEYAEVEAFTRENAITVVHFINRRRKSYTSAKDYEFARVAMLEHWAAGREDAYASLGHREWIRRRLPKHGVAVFDLALDRVTYTSADGSQEIHGHGGDQESRMADRPIAARRSR
jgi:NTE family protein